MLNNETYTARKYQKDQTRYVRVAVPDHRAGSVEQEGVGDALDAGLLSKSGQLASLVDADDVIHLSTHLVDELGHLGLVLGGNPDEGDVGELLGQLGQVGDAG